MAPFSIDYATKATRLDPFPGMSIVANPLRPTLERSQAEIASQYHILLESSALLTQLAMPHLQAVKGSVINISSAVGRSIPYPPMGVGLPSMPPPRRASTSLPVTWPVNSARPGCVSTPSHPV
jgi:NAD(P)-dependent dehydrogenase (short-subunit alcohol dehydrogenase family)